MSTAPKAEKAEQKPASAPARKKAGKTVSKAEAQANAKLKADAAKVEKAKAAVAKAAKAAKAKAAKAAKSAKAEAAAKDARPVASAKSTKAAKPAPTAKAVTSVAKPAVKTEKPAKKNQAADTTSKHSTHVQSRLAQVLIAPIVSEKATMAAEKHNQILFKVMRDATKPEIKAAVELMFKVTVASVQTVQHKGKEKRFGKSNGRRDHVKKAYVCLAPGQELNFTGEGA